MNVATDKLWEKMFNALEKTGKWKYDGCDQWIEKSTNLRYSTPIAYEMMKTQNCAGNLKLDQWHKDSMGDYVIEVRNLATDRLVRGRIIRCPIVSQFAQRFWRTKSRFLLLTNDSQYGFYRSVREAMARWEKDCKPTNSKCPECGQLAGSPQCCQEDEELWK